MKRMFSAAKQPDKPTNLVLYVYDDIGESFWSEGVTAKGIAAALAEAGKIESITMRINSPGGDVFEGLTIMNLVRTQGVPVTVMVDGLAASAASIIAMAGDRIVMADNALLMIHNAWMVAIGDAAALRKSADTLDTVSGALVDTYAKRSGQTADAVQAMMDAETWLGAAEAVAKGFATEVLEIPKEEGAAAMALVASFDLARRFSHTPDVLTRPAASTAPAPEPEPAAVAPDFASLELDLLAVELGAAA